MKFLFVGCGSIGRRHIQNLKSLTRCEILAYRVRREPLGAFGRRHGIREFSRLARALDAKPDAVFITNPTSHHLRVARAVAARGIPMFIEKPLSHSMAGVNAFLRACKRKRVPVLLGYKMRFHPAILRVRDLIRRGAIGRVLAARVRYGGYLPDWHPWEDYRRMYSARRRLGGGIILDSIHEIDYLVWMLGPVRRVRAMGGQLSRLQIDTEDVAEILLEFRSGAVGNVHLNYVQRPEKRSCEIIGEKGTISWNQDAKGVRLTDGGSGRTRKFSQNGFKANDMFLAEIKHFLRVIRRGERPVHRLEEARDVLKIALSAQRQCSMRSR